MPFMISITSLKNSTASMLPLSGKRQTTCPVFFIRGIADVRHAHPRDQDRLIRILQVVGAGSRVGIESEVQYVELAVRREGQGIPVPRSL